MEVIFRALEVVIEAVAQTNKHKNTQAEKANTTHRIFNQILQSNDVTLKIDNL